MRTPRILGVDPTEFARRGAFTFVETTDDVDPENPWLALNRTRDDHTIPAFADQTVIEWGLGKRVGDSLDYLDERGRVFKLTLVGGLANSIFQGSVLISNKAFLHRFPSVSGGRVLLVDSPEAKTDGPLSDALAEALQDLGLEITPTAQRLAEFNAVENTYLNIFLALGGLGLLLGSIGMAIVVARNVAERRHELALLRALGFSRWSLQQLLLREHMLLLGLGTAAGMVSAFVAVLPAIASPGGEMPLLSTTLLVIGILVNGAAWTCLATQLVTCGAFLPALRNE